MLDILIVTLLVTLFVLGLFGLVQWVLSFFPRLNPTRLHPPVGKWWIILLGVVMWLNTLSELLKKESSSAWTKDDYLNVFYLCALSYLIVFVWRWTTKPTKESTKETAFKDGGERQL